MTSHPLIPLPKQPADTPWPTDDWPTAPMPESADKDRLSQLINNAFSDTETYGHTHSFIAIQRGKIVLERYGDGKTADDTFHSWSMAKSMTQALVGIARDEAGLDIHAPANVPEWHETPDDTRAKITLDQLLRMVSGLQFREEYADAGVSDTIEMLFASGKDDTAHYAARRPLEHEPDTHWSYSSGTTNIIARALQQVLKLDQPGFEAFMIDRLFKPLGMTSPQPKFDAAGTFIGSSFCFCTARDFARFGLLYLRDGVWDGQRILPEGWVDYARTPVPIVPQEEPMGYGAQWWLGLAGEGSFSANGYDGQYIVLVPQKDLILVRNGQSEAQKDTVRAWLADVADCFE